MTSPTHTNRLAGRSSPYLLQHAHNPVDWYPWGDEAFEEARRRDVPIFLSIGYSTCYWCHVMERESFEHEATAAVMNERFVCIKVDREERPDVDDLYMTATQVMTGRGGWPMSCFLEPGSLRPFWCGTYFPRESRHGLPSFTQVLRGMSDAWRERRDEVLEQSGQVAEAVRESLAGDAEAVPVGPAHVSLAVESLLRSFDRTNGGFGGAPKFPQPANLMLLLDAREAADEDTRAGIDVVVRATLDRMAIGGMHDQVGGGFHRYSVDETWTVPHFEKMLYDNAQLAMLYARAATIYGDEYYRHVTRRTLDYVLREMTSGDEPGAAGFFSAQDAEVDGREGLNYLWTPDEIREALPEEDAALAISVYTLDKGANFRDPHHPDEPARHVLRLLDRPDRVAPDFKMSPEELGARMGALNGRLFEARAQRRQPGLDDKIIVAWNGLMIEALAEGAEALEERAYFDAANRAAEYILTHMRGADGVLLRIARAGTASTPAFLEDHAALILGLVALGRSRFARDRSRLDDAMAIADLAHEAFAGEGGYFDTRAGQGDLFVRTRSTYDGAMACGSSLMLGALLSLAETTGEARFLDRAALVLGSLSPRLAHSPVSVVEGARQLLRSVRMRDRMGDRYEFDMGGLPEREAPPQPVRAFVSADRVEVGEDRPATLRLRLEIDEAFHIVGSDPGPGGEGLSALRVGLVRGQGVAVYADYPEGEELVTGAEGVGPIRVHHGVVELDVALERKPGVGVGPGAPVLGVSFQACTDTECLRAMTVQLGVEIDLLD